MNEVDGIQNFVHGYQEDQAQRAHDSFVGAMVGGLLGMLFQRLFRRS